MTRVGKGNVSITVIGRLMSTSHSGSPADVETKDVALIITVSTDGGPQSTP